MTTQRIQDLETDIAAHERILSERREELDRLKKETKRYKPEDFKEVAAIFLTNSFRQEQISTLSNWKTRVHSQDLINRQPDRLYASSRNKLEDDHTNGFTGFAITLLDTRNNLIIACLPDNSSNVNKDLVSDDGYPKPDMVTRFQKELADMMNKEKN